jgi:hypothetical protein
MESLVNAVARLETQVSALRREVADMSAALDFHTRQLVKSVEQVPVVTSDRGEKVDYEVLPVHEELAVMMLRAKAMKLCEGDD